MAEDIIIDNNLAKEEIYKQLLPQIHALIDGENNRIANMANVAAALKQAFDFFWVGFYLIDNNELVLGPFQGPVACTRIKFGSGVCGTSWAKEEIFLVPDVDQFPGHIACSTESKSEIVVPGFDKNGVIKFVLDVDSDKLDDFDEIDKQYLKKLTSIIE